jgi:hypothetical protein
VAYPVLEQGGTAQLAAVAESDPITLAAGAIRPSRPA